MYSLSLQKEEKPVVCYHSKGVWSPRDLPSGLLIETIGEEIDAVRTPPPFCLPEVSRLHLEVGAVRFSP